MIERDWYGCYGKGWTNIITPDAFAHPAKFSRGLIRRIYGHLFEEGYLKEGATVIDPFGGVALGALHAMQHGCHWIGVELEQKFIDLGSYYDCPGFTAGEWRRYYHRVDRVNNGPHHHWCPDCVEAMRNVGKSRKIPMHGAHRYQGNIDLWMETYAPHFPKWGSAVLIRGDSRELAQVVGQVVGASVSSPPFPDNGAGDTRFGGGLQDKNIIKASKLGGGGLTAYGDSLGQLGNLRATDADHAAALRQVAGAVSSPPYGKDVEPHGDLRPTGTTFEEMRGYKAVTADHAAALRQVAGAVSSPPYAECLSNPSNKIELTGQGGPIHPRYYGIANGQLGAMPTGDLQAVVSSPPYAASLASDDPDKRGGLFRDPKRRSDKTLTAEYGESEGQIGKEQGDTFWSAAKTIVEQTYQVLAPGAVAVWVCKSFVRKKKRVDFPSQWRELGEAVGFETIELIRAWLVEDRGAQYTLTGELDERKVERKSFFRRLAESKGSPRIDYEVVIIQRKI